jgi:FixJ family two-component response regulator
MSAEPTVFVIDDNAEVRRSLRALMKSAGLAVETYASGEEFLDGYDASRPGCLLLDIRLRGSSGLDLQDELRRRNAALPVIVMTGYGNVPTSVRALRGGAIDFLQKPIAPKRLLERIHEALEIDRHAREVATTRTAVAARLARLTPREREITELLVAGKSSKEIAAALHLSVRTVEGHRRGVLRKMEVSSAAHLAGTVLRARGQ